MRNASRKRSYRDSDCHFFTTLVSAHMIVITLSDDSCSFVMFVVEGPVPHGPANVVVYAHASCTGCAAPAKSSLNTSEEYNGHVHTLYMYLETGYVRSSILHHWQPQLIIIYWRHRRNSQSCRWRPRGPRCNLSLRI